MYHFREIRLRKKNSEGKEQEQCQTQKEIDQEKRLRFGQKRSLLSDTSMRPGGQISIFRFDQTLKGRSDSDNIYLSEHLETEIRGGSAVKIVYRRDTAFSLCSIFRWSSSSFSQLHRGSIFKNAEWILSLNNHINLLE